MTEAPENNYPETEKQTSSMHICPRWCYVYCVCYTQIACTMESHLFISKSCRINCVRKATDTRWSNGNRPYTWFRSRKGRAGNGDTGPSSVFSNKCTKHPNWPPTPRQTFWPLHASLLTGLLYNLPLRHHNANKSNFHKVSNYIK